MGMCVADSASFPGYFSLRSHDLGMRLYQEWLNQFINKKFFSCSGDGNPPTMAPVAAPESLSSQSHAGGGP